LILSRKKSHVKPEVNLWRQKEEGQKAKRGEKKRRRCGNSGSKPGGSREDKGSKTEKRHTGKREKKKQLRKAYSRLGGG